MAHQNLTIEGTSSNRPPLLIGSENYNFWKHRVMVFIQRDPMEWRVVELGQFVYKNEKGEPKKVEDLTYAELARVAYDGKAKNILLSGLSAMEIDKASSCKTAKEIWDILQLIHEG